MTIKFDPVWKLYVFLLKSKFFLSFCALLFISPFVFSSSSKKEFLIETGLFSDYRVKSGYDPFMPCLFKGYVAGDNFLDYFTRFAFKFENPKVKFKSSFSFSKDVTTTFFVRSGLDALDIEIRDSEMDKLSSSEFVWSSFFSHRLFSFFSYFLEADLSLKNSSAFLPNYITYKRHLASELEKKHTTSVGFFYHSSLGAVGLRLPFKVESSSVRGIKSNNFYLGSKPVLSYDVLFRSKKLLNGLVRIYSQFSFNEKRHNKSYYNTREYSWSGRLKFYFDSFFYMDTSSIWSIKDYTFDRADESQLLVHLNFLITKFQKLSFFYEFFKSRFEKGMEYSSVSQKVTLSYSLRLGYAW